MTRMLRQIRVLISSPSDVNLYRETAIQIANEINRLLGAERSIQLDSIAWETDIMPGIGTDPQEVINRQLPDYEIYLGIMGARFGTATPRAGSGTLEEFEQAVTLWKKDPKAIDILFYFDVERIPFDTDPDQLAAVQEFKKGLMNKGVLSKDFADVEQFKSLLLRDLMEAARKWNQALVTPSKETRTFPSPAVDASPQSMEEKMVSAFSEVDDALEEGPLDLLAASEEAMEKTTTLVEEIGEGISKLGARAEERAGDIQKLGIVTNPSPRQIRKVINQSADDLGQFAVTIGADLPSLREAWGTYVDKASRFLSMSGNEIPVKDLEGTKDSLEGLETSMIEAHTAIQELRASIAGVPPLTSEYRKASRKALQSLDDLLDFLSKETSFLPQLTHAIQQRIDEMS